MARLPLHLNTRTFTSHLFFGPYIFFPIIAGLTWLGGILALLLLWVTDGKPRYRGDEASVVFISDVGAVHKTLFICICCVTAGFYILSLFSERWLRHVDRLPVDLRTREKIFDWLAIFFGVVGSAGLILLSIFDTFNHSTVHWSMTLVFVVGVAISAIFQSGEIWSLHKDHPDRKSLLRNSILKLIVVGFAVLTAIAFGITYGLCSGDIDPKGRFSAAQCNRITSACAALEWTVAFILVFYFLTLAADLWPAGKSSERYMRRLAKWQEKHGEGDDFTGRRAFEEHPERWQDRFALMRRNMWARNNGQEKFVATQPSINDVEQGSVVGNGGYVGRDSMASSTPMMSQTAAPATGQPTMAPPPPAGGQGYDSSQIVQTNDGPRVY